MNVKLYTKTINRIVFELEAYRVHAMNRMTFVSMATVLLLVGIN